MSWKQYVDGSNINFSYNEGDEPNEFGMSLVVKREKRVANEPSSLRIRYEVFLH